MRAARSRLDSLLVNRGLVADQRSAQSLIMAGDVLVDDVPVDKAGAMVAEDSLIRLRDRAQFVSRGGDKLAAALDNFAIDVSRKIIIDIGSSTGGFTDCVLQRGAQRVYAVDVGTNQLDWKLRNDPRVVSLEQTNARELDSIPSATIVPKPELAVIDVSFISPRLLIIPLLKLCGDTLREIVVLVKPQFELPSEQVQGGVVRDSALHAEACRMVREELVTRGFECSEPFLSPVPGQKKGNLEFFLRARRM